MTSSVGLLFFDKHRSTLTAAAAASRSRDAWSAYEGATSEDPGEAERAFAAHLGWRPCTPPGRALP